MRKHRDALVASVVGLLALAAAAGASVAAGCEAAAEPTFQRGVNLSHWLSQPLHESWGRRFGVEGETFTAEGRARWFNEGQAAAIARAGFDHIRLLVDWDRLLASASRDAPLREDGFAEIDAVLTWARARGLGVVLTAYTLPGHYFMTRSENTIWRDTEQRAAHATSGARSRGAIGSAGRSCAMSCSTSRFRTSRPPGTRSPESSSPPFGASIPTVSW